MNMSKLLNFELPTDLLQKPRMLKPTLFEDMDTKMNRDDFEAKVKADLEQWIADCGCEITNYSSKATTVKTTHFWAVSCDGKNSIVKATIYYLKPPVELGNYGILMYYKQGKRYEGLEYNMEFKFKIVAW